MKQTTFRDSSTPFDLQLPRVRARRLLIIGLALSFSGFNVNLAEVDGPILQSGARVLAAQKKDEKPAAAGPQDFRSKNFLVHTDLPAADARGLLERLEKMIALISRYWGRPNPKQIECFVVKDLKNWPAGSLEQRGLQSIRAGGGVTLSQVLFRGNSFAATATVYAVADRGTPQHEAVHAYCAHAFGRTGPMWYSEGMAEMGQYWRDNDASVNCHPVVVRYIRESPPRSLNKIINQDQVVADTWQDYAWRWALCHLLANNPNYNERFRPLGLGLLTKQNVSFERVYGAMAKEISFEYLFFLKNFDRGYRVDLCAWDWKAKYRRPRGSGSLLSKIDAAHGWQPSRLLVRKDEEYEYTATGNWQTSETAKMVDANGAADGTGKLMGIVFEDYQLSEPFELGVAGTFKAPTSGKLLLRCRDKWIELADNKGKLSVRIKVKKSKAAARR